MENRPLKIGLFNECFPPIQDGVSQVVENYARLLTERGNDVTVATAKVPFFDYPQTYDVKNIASVPMIFRLPYRVGLPTWMVPLQPIMKYKCDILHLHSPFTAGRIALKLGKKNHTPVIATFHSKFRDDFIRSVKFDWAADFMVRHIMEVFEAADEVWVPQKSVLEVMRSYGYKGKAEIVPNAVDYDLTDFDLPGLRAQARHMIGITDDVPCLLFVGQIIKEKRVDFILESLQLLKKKGVKFRAFFIGKGYWTEELRLGIITKRLKDCVEYKGQLHDRSALQLYYAASDLFLFPSLYDNAPLVVREAAVHHTASILTEGCTSAEVIDHDVNGFLAPNRTTEEFAETIINIFSDKERLERVSAGAASTLGLTWKQLMPEVEDRYRHLIQRRNEK
ncbi:MAG: glycosyltransferase [Paludibacteraceae bacterium]|nr:glycosyltransferase [Paludibacteraceae bacterium]